MPNNFDLNPNSLTNVKFFYYNDDSQCSYFITLYEGEQYSCNARARDVTVTLLVITNCVCEHFNELEQRIANRNVKIVKLCEVFILTKSHFLRINLQTFC